MAKISRKKVFISDKDLKKSILNANKNLTSKNNFLKSQIKDSEGKLKDLESQEKVLFNRIKQVQDRLATDEANAHSVAQTLNKYNEQLSVAKSTCSKMQLEESKVLEKVEKLSQKVAKLSKEIDFFEIKKTEYSGLKKSIKDAKLKINNINNDIDSLSKERFEIAQSVDSLQSQYDTKVEFYKQESKSLSENHKKLYANYEKKSQEIIDLENSLKDKKQEYNISIDEYEDDIKSRISLISKKEDDYYKWERKVENMKNSVKEEKSRIAKIKENYSKWKVIALEEVARLKLKGKIENIDKAGLGEILNG